MKNLFVLVIALCASFMSQAQFTGASLTAAGLTCAMCTKAIYTELEKLPGVASVDVDIKSSAFKIKYKQDAKADPDALKAAVEDAGFSIAKLELTGDFDNIDIKNDAHVNIAGITFHFLKVNPSSLSGTRTLRLVDKNFLSAKEFKKYTAATDYPCAETGKAEECCAKTGLKGNSRIYHVTL
jgi:copper chaperone CopZ